MSKLANASFLNTFGRQAGPKQAQIFTTIGALRFAGNIPEKFINRTSVRGIPCNLWRSCVYMSGYNATAVVDWYFSGKTVTIIPYLPYFGHLNFVCFIRVLRPFQQ